MSQILILIYLSTMLQMLVMVVKKTIKNVLDSFNRTSLITYSMYLKEQTKHYKENEFNIQNCTYYEIRYVITGEIQIKRELGIVLMTTNIRKMVALRATKKTLKIKYSGNSILLYIIFLS
jgi:hypothetical protein